MCWIHSICELIGTYQSGNLYRSKEQMNLKIGRLRKCAARGFGMPGGEFGLSFPFLFAFALPRLKLLFPNIHVAQCFDALSPEHTSRGTYTEARSKCMCRSEAKGGVWSASDFPCTGSVIMKSASNIVNELV